ncbi:MAG: decarboxylase [Nanoarchaeota archaeon]|nr:decarboxylase [Nanoarchaeota archaeon]MBU1031295.1 decarboxylase [Nanoarchaeota archaeon]MBU1849440.1 decarboxylase [Nanoarchaeota archaeon]
MRKPKFILSRKKVLEQYNKVELITNIVSYSSKTNPLITTILEEETNSMFSIHLSTELENVKDKSRVIFLAQGWTFEEIEKLIKVGVKHFVVDNEPDLEVILLFLGKNHVKINIHLRVKLKENSLRTEKYFVFGMNSEVVSEKLKFLSKNPFIESLGIHFHRKTQNMSEWNLQYELENMFEEETFEIIKYVNIGGGIPSMYANTNFDVIKTVLKKIKNLRDWLNKKNISMIVEPGRFISAPACKLETSIIRMYDNNIIVNASVYNSDLDALIVPVKLLVLGEMQPGEGEPFVIKGITPCSMDLFRYRVYLKNPKVGDKIVFLNAGAYNFTSDFCNLERIETEIID